LKITTKEGNMAQTHIAAEVFPPGEFLRDELEARGWTQIDIADIMGRPVQMVNEIVAGKKAITPETAKALGAALGTSAELWMNLETTYQLSLVNREVGDVEKRAKLYNKVPIKEMVRRQWIRDQNDTDDLEQELLKFLEIPDIDATPKISFAARKGTDYVETTPAELAWFCRAMKLGRAIHAKKFSPDRFEKWLATVPALVGSEFEIQKLPKLLADVGVRLVVIKHLAKTKIDGAAIWLDNQTPVVVISLRYGRIDYFWFTLCHELMHILHHDDNSVDSSLVGESAERTADKPEFEQRADREATEILVNQQALERFILRVKPLYSKQRINQFANVLQVHPGIIVGQLQRRDEIGYDHSREMLVDIREILLPVALSDGWGYKPPVL
jgi:HTH-type transcriptional regulator/antitoxin HigA